MYIYYLKKKSICDELYAQSFQLSQIYQDSPWILFFQTVLQGITTELLIVLEATDISCDNIY